MSSFTPQTWKPEYKGQANLHVFEDWCGSTTADLRKNLHYPLYPHSRTTVQKLAVTPQWTNYGLRIFGYLHPYADGEFVFALSSDDNSELWFSTDDSPFNLELLAWVGKTGKEWTAPGEYEKYASQISRPVWLFARRKYFFEVIHKQNDRGTDHVEVAWQLLDRNAEFMVIESPHISLYTNESAFSMSDVRHVPQTAASYPHTLTKQHSVAADMLIEDRRDTFHQVNLINSKFLKGVLPDCSYNPSYIIKDFPLLRYQGLQFVHLSYVYPNDYTRLTHMETENSCFYSESAYYLKMFGFSRYMKLDRPGGQVKENTDFDFLRRKSALDFENEHYNEALDRQKETKLPQMDNALLQDYGDDYDDYAQKRRRKLFALMSHETNKTQGNSSLKRLKKQKLQRRQGGKNMFHPQPEPEKIPKPLKPVPIKASKQNQTEVKQQGEIIKQGQMKPEVKLKPVKKQKVKSVVKPGQNDSLTIVEKEGIKGKQKAHVPSEHLGSKQRRVRKSHKIKQPQIQSIKDSQLQNKHNDEPLPERPTVAFQGSFVIREKALPEATLKGFTTSKRDIHHVEERSNQRYEDARKSLREKEIEMNMPLQNLDNSVYKTKVNAKEKKDKKWSSLNGVEEDHIREDDEDYNRVERRGGSRAYEREGLWGQGGDFDDISDEDLTPTPMVDPQVIWNQTFQVNHLNLQAQRSDWIDLQCNTSGNLILHSSDAWPIVATFMDQLNEKHHGRFTLVRVVNVVKRVDGFQGSRYLLELELKDANGQLLRLSHYIYVLIRHSWSQNEEFGYQRKKPQLLLCYPKGFHWNPVATVHFIVPVKNQARWVQQLINDMEDLFRQTGDMHFNLIIADYNSTDMDVQKALEKSSLPRYQYVKLSGNFERSAGLQAGIDLINDDHSIVFLCDLHIHFPPSIIDTIRKHCVEGHMAFAPIVLRLGCGATPFEARGYWEVNGFGLLGIYMSDLNSIGGMNTREFKERWGGEDWELLDRILQGGLEVERLYLRNFFHHYHSKRGMWNRKTSTRHR
ncbi:beta-1,4-N-acetylgalactosaminyltransferase 3 [Pholidichthys leucotaenia]